MLYICRRTTGTALLKHGVCRNNDRKNGKEDYFIAMDWDDLVDITHEY